MVAGDNIGCCAPGGIGAGGSLGCAHMEVSQLEVLELVSSGFDWMQQPHLLIFRPSFTGAAILLVSVFSLFPSSSRSSPPH
ncbi:uncharacterized [Tachysurus ichikawai]